MSRIQVVTVIDYSVTFNLDGTPLEVYWTEDESPLPTDLTFTIIEAEPDAISAE